MSDLDLLGRAGRDLVLDLLAVGQTYPLRDVPVGFLRTGGPRVTVVPSGSVALGVAGQIVVAYSQPDVDYVLCDLSGTPVPESGAALPGSVGNVPIVTLPTPPIEEDRTLRVRGTKRHSGRTALLAASVTVHVGFDLALQVRIEPTTDVTVDGDLVTLPTGTVLTVAVDDSQAGVQYSLVSNDGTSLSDAVAGQRGTISLTSSAVTADTLLRVQVERTVDGQSSVDRLQAAFRLVLQPRGSVAVTTDPADGIVDVGAAARVLVAGEDGVRYQAYARPVGPREWRRDENGTVSLPPTGDPLVWSDPPGFSPLGSPIAATGGSAALDVPTVTANTQLIVQASRDGTLPPPVTTSVELASSVVLLIRPDPAPELLLRVWLVPGPSGEAPGFAAALDAVTDGRMEVVGGQPGVRYVPQSPPGTPVSSLPAYVHRRNGSVNVGIGDLTVGVDLAVLRAPATPVADPASAVPLPPLLGTVPLAVGSKLAVVGTWAETAVPQTLAATAEVQAVPVVQVDSTDPAAVTVTVPAALGSRFQLRVDGQPTGPPQDGTGTDLVLTVPVPTGSALELAVRDLAPGQLPLERVVALPLVSTPPSVPPSGPSGSSGSEPAA